MIAVYFLEPIQNSLDQSLQDFFSLIDERIFF